MMEMKLKTHVIYNNDSHNVVMMQISRNIEQKILFIFLISYILPVDHLTQLIRYILLYLHCVTIHLLISVPSLQTNWT